MKHLVHGLALLASFLLGVACASTGMQAAEQAAAASPARTLPPEALRYLGAFRLPEGGERPKTFSYGGNAMTFNPAGDPSGKRDGFPGSLFITGHERMPYGDLPDGNQVAEVTIPKPVRSKDLKALKRARFLQRFHDVAKGRFTAYDELPTVGLQYLDTPGTGAKIHVAWGHHFEPEKPAPTHGWFSPKLAKPDFRGEWFLAGRSFYTANG